MYAGTSFRLEYNDLLLLTTSLPHFTSLTERILSQRGLQFLQGSERRVACFVKLCCQLGMGA